MFKQLTLRTKILIGAALACAVYVVMMPGGSQTIEPTRESGAEPVRHAPASASLHASAANAKSATRAAVYRMGDRIVKETAAGALFSSQSWYVAPPPPPPVAYVAPPPPVPTAPPLPFAFMGSMRPDGATQTFFLTAGDRVYDVKIGDTLDNTYTVDGVKSGQLLLTYIPLKIQQSLAVGDDQ